MRGFLRDRGDARLAGQVDVAAVGLDIAHQRSKQAGLAGAVATDHADAVAGVQGQVDIGQQQAFAATQGEIAEGNHRRNCSRRRGDGFAGPAFDYLIMT